MIITTEAQVKQKPNYNVTLMTNVEQTRDTQRDTYLPELFYDITIFVLLYLECQSIQSTSNLALDVINNISKDLCCK